MDIPRYIHFFCPFCGRILKLLWLPWFLTSHQYPPKSSHFPEGGAIAQVCDFSLAPPPTPPQSWSFWWCLLDFLLHVTPACTGSWLQGQWGCYLVLGVLGVPVDPTQWSETWVNHIQRLVGRLLSSVSRNYILLMPFNILVFSQTTLAPVIKAAHHWGSQALLSFPHRRSYHWWIVQPCAVLLCESSSYSLHWTRFVFFVPIVSWNLLLGSLDFLWILCHPCIST